MPVTINLPIRITQDFQRRRTGLPQSIKNEKFVYIPILDQLQRLLNNREVYLSVMTPPNDPQPDVFTSYEDGNKFKQSSLFQAHPNSLQLHFYLDEVQMCNAIGSYDQKVVFVYFRLGRLKDHFRSTFKAINLISIFKNDLIEKCGINSILKYVVDDIKLLEQGFPFVINGRTEFIRGTITAVCADNLASHEIGGFKKGFGCGFRKCRFCYATSEEIQTKFVDFQFVAREEKDHDEQCAALDVEELREHVSFLYGLRQNSVLNHLDHFHVTSGLPPDAMHDLLEGVIPYTMVPLLARFIRKKYFTLKELNYKIKNFKYGTGEIKDKPSVIKHQHLFTSKTIRGSASQKWLLAVMLPLMVGSRVPRNDRAWKCFICLLKICRLVFQSKISELELLYLGDCIARFLTLFKKCFKLPIIPKMHFLVHYPRLIREFGPLLSLWCMNFEAKHAYFKSMQKRIGNWINVPFTLAYRHQQWMSEKLRDTDGFLKVYCRGIIF